MLGLKLPTDPRWVNIVQQDLQEILTDHAYCEQKAASNAISILVSFPYYTDLVSAMVQLAKEELTHFEMVHHKIIERGYKLGFERKDEYVGEMHNFMRKGHKKEIVLIDRLLFGAIIEARSCERFKILSQQIPDDDLKQFYYELMISEAHHYTLFINFAKKYGSQVEDVDLRWQQWLMFEAQVLNRYSASGTMHG